MDTRVSRQSAAQMRASSTVPRRRRPRGAFAARLQAALGQLSDEELQVLRWRFGLDAPVLEPEEIAEQLAASVPDVWDLEAQALETLGFLLLTATTPRERELACTAEAA